MNARENFLKATLILAKSSPMAWHDFIAALNEYVAVEIEQGLKTTTADTYIAVGMGRRLVELRNDFRDIEQIGIKLKLIT